MKNLHMQAMEVEMGDQFTSWQTGEYLWKHWT